MKIPGTGLLKTGAKIAVNPAGFAADQVVSRVIETDEDGKELPEVHAFQVKMDRMVALLAFIAERMDLEGFEAQFGTVVDGDTEGADKPQEDVQEEEQWL